MINIYILSGSFSFCHLLFPFISDSLYFCVPFRTVSFSLCPHSRMKAKQIHLNMTDRGQNNLAHIQCSSQFILTHERTETRQQRPKAFMFQTQSVARIIQTTKIRTHLKREPNKKNGHFLHRKNGTKLHCQQLKLAVTNNPYIEIILWT